MILVSKPIRHEGVQRGADKLIWKACSMSHEVSCSCFFLLFFFLGGIDFQSECHVRLPHRQSYTCKTKKKRESTLGPSLGTRTASCCSTKEDFFNLPEQVTPLWYEGLVFFCGREHVRPQTRFLCVNAEQKLVDYGSVTDHLGLHTSLSHESLPDAHPEINK